MMAAMPRVQAALEAATEHLHADETRA